MGPSRPPDTRRDVGMPTRFQRRESSRMSTAYDNTNRVFNAILPYIGQKRLMPLVYFADKTPGAHPVLDPEADPAVPAGVAWFRNYLKGRGMSTYRNGVVDIPHGADYAMDEPLTRGTWLHVLLHELAHTQQGPLTWDERNPRQQHLQVEGGADAFASALQALIARKLGWGKIQFPPAPYGPLGGQALHEKGYRWVTRDQFSGRPW